MEGLPKEEKSTSEQREQMRNFSMYKEVNGLAIGSDESEEGWEFIGFNEKSGLVSLVKADGSTRDVEVGKFLELNNK